MAFGRVVGGRPRSATLAILATVALVAGQPAAALGAEALDETSTNWAGYAITAEAPFVHASGSWTQPSAACLPGSPTFSSFWVGMGGFDGGSASLEQIGSAAECAADGQLVTYAWYELPPAAPVTIDVLVRPGDRLVAAVAVEGHQVDFRLRNLSTGRGFFLSTSADSVDTSSAEWIAEAPSSCDDAGRCTPLALSDFDTVRFSAPLATTADGHRGTIDDSAFSATQLTLMGESPVSVGSRAPNVAAPGPLGPGGRFSVTVPEAHARHAGRRQYGTRLHRTSEPRTRAGRRAAPPRISRPRSIRTHRAPGR